MREGIEADPAGGEHVEQAAEQGRETETRLGVVIVEPYPVVRAGLVRLISEHPGLKVDADTGDADGALAAVERIHGSRVGFLVSMGLTGSRDSAWLIRSVRERSPGSVILGMGANADPQTISRALFVGADGFVDKQAEPEEFLSGIERARSQEVVIVGPEEGSLGEIAAGLERRRDDVIRLTRREREVLTIAAEGLTARMIAERLGVRERTITTHLSRIYGKLGVGSRLGAVRVAARSGLLVTGTLDRR
jgi:two-component system, NarL family, nitrate/nitrite response regulator NarL